MAQVAGLPRPVAILFADIAASIASEGTKGAGRRARRENIELNEEYDDNSLYDKNITITSISEYNITTFPVSNSYPMPNISVNELLPSLINSINSTISPINLNVLEDITSKITTTLKNNSLNNSITLNWNPLPLISVSEITMDVSKWVAYDLLLSDSDSVPLLEAATCGAEAGLTAILVVEVLKTLKIAGFQGNETIWSTIPIQTRLIRAAIEGAVLFWAYEGSLVYCNKLFPDKIKEYLERKFDFI